MIKLVRCLKRRSDISAEKFRRFWNDPEYESLLGKLGEVSELISHTRSLTLQIDINQELADLHGTLEPYDAVVELCWKDAKTVFAARNSDIGMLQSLAAFRPDQPCASTASSSSATMLVILIIGFTAGPAVSL